MIIPKDTPGLDEFFAWLEDKSEDKPACIECSAAGMQVLKDRYGPDKPIIVEGKK